jgi:uncharacterized protein YydD (DUF2326 family)
MDEETGERVFNWERWKTLLGWTLFGLPRSNNAFKYMPTYRSLISYFVRRGHDAYNDPFRHFRQQKPWDIQLNTAYLLGLNWEYATQWQSLKDQENGIKAIDQAIKSGAMEGLVGNVTDKAGIQYICTLNSDMVPRDDFSDGFDFDQHVRLTLTDKAQSGSLLGVRFERRGK